MPSVFESISRDLLRQRFDNMCRVSLGALPLVLVAYSAELCDL